MADSVARDPQTAAFLDSLRDVRIAGRYVMETILGAGGMGVVTSARYPELDQRVAVKFLKPQFAAQELLSARFLREARIAATIESPHLVRVFDIGRLDGGVPFMVMEFLAGHDLDHELQQKGQLDIEDAVDVILQVCVGLGQVHANNVVHRDLKPSNLFLAIGRGGARTVKILDFGISKQSSTTKSADLTDTEHFLGTPQYMSPEQIRDAKRTDARTDVWALGIILYEMLTGRRPFKQEGDSVGELFGIIMFTDPIPPTERRADLPPALSAVILKCLKRDREERYTSVAELATALAPFASKSTQHRVDDVKRALASFRPPAAQLRNEARGAHSRTTARLDDYPDASVPRRAPTKEPATTQTIDLDDIEIGSAGGARAIDGRSAERARRSMRSFGLLLFSGVVVAVVGGAVALGTSESKSPASSSAAGTASVTSTASVIGGTLPSSVVPESPRAVPSSVPVVLDPSTAPPTFSASARSRRPPPVKHPAASGTPSPTPSAAPRATARDRGI